MNVFTVIFVTVCLLNSSIHFLKKILLTPDFCTVVFVEMSRNHIGSELKHCCYFVIEH